MLLKNFFLKVFDTSPRNLNLEAGPEQKAGALADVLGDLTNQEIINLTSKLDDDTALSDTETRILTTLGILQSIAISDSARTDKFSDKEKKILALVNSPEFADFLDALAKSPELYEASVAHLKARTDAMATSTTDRASLATDVVATSVELRPVTVDGFIEDMAVGYTELYPGMNTAQIVAQIIADNPGVIHKVTDKTLAKITTNKSTWTSHKGDHYSTSATIKIRTKAPVPIPTALQMSTEPAQTPARPGTLMRDDYTEDTADAQSADTAYATSEKKREDALSTERADYTEGLDGTYDSGSERRDERRDFRQLKQTKGEITDESFRAHSRDLDKWGVSFLGLDSMGGEFSQATREILAKEPFKWDYENGRLNRFQEAMMKGRNRVLKFQDIITTMAQYGQLDVVNFKQFQTEYERLNKPGYLEGLSAETERLRQEYEALMADDETFETTDFSEVDISSQDTRLISKKYKNDLSRKRDDESIQQWKARVEAEEDRLDRETVNGTDKEEKGLRKRKLELCKFIVAKIETKQGQFTKPAEEAYRAALAKETAERDKLAKYNSIIDGFNELIASFETLQAGEQSQQLGSPESRTARYEGAGADSGEIASMALLEEVADEASDPSKGYSVFDVMEEERLGSSKKTDVADRRFDRSVMVDDLERQHSEFVDGRRQLDATGLRTHMQGLVTGGLGYLERSMKSHKDARHKRAIIESVDLVAIAETLTDVDISKEELRKIKEVEKELQKATKEYIKIEEEKEKVEAKIAKLKGKLRNKELRDKDEQVKDIEEKLKTEEAELALIETKLGTAHKERAKIQTRFEGLYLSLIAKLKGSKELSTLTLDATTEAQRQLIRIGYVAERQQREAIESVEYSTTTIESLLEEFPANTYPLHNAALQALQETGRTFTSEELELIIQEINLQAEGGLVVDTASLPPEPEDRRTGSTSTHSVGGLGVRTDEDLGITKVTATKLFTLPKGLGTVSVSLTCKTQNPRQLLRPMPTVGYSGQILDTQIVDASITATASIGSVSGTASFAIGNEKKAQFYLAGGGQIAYGMPGYHFGVGFNVSAEGSVERQEHRELTRQGIAQIDENDATAIRTLPQFKETIRSLEASTPQLSREQIDQILIMQFKGAKRDAETSASEKATIFPIRGAGVGVMNVNELLRALGLEPRHIPVGKVIPMHFPVVFVTLAFKGKTMVVPFLPEGNDLATLLGETDIEIQRALFGVYNQQDAELRGFCEGSVEPLARSGGIRMDAETGELESDGSVKLGDLHLGIGQSLTDLNTAYQDIGIGLQEGPNETLKLDFYKNRIQGTVEIHSDGVKVIREGNPPSLDSLYIGFDRLRDNLFIEVREIQLARPDEFGNTTRTIIHIKTNPQRNRAQIDRDESSYLIGGIHHSVVERKKRASADGNELETWDEASVTGGTLEQQEALRTQEEYVTEVETSLGTMRSALDRQSPVVPGMPMRGDEYLANLATTFMADKSNQKLFRQLSTMTFDTGDINPASKAELTRVINQYQQESDPGSPALQDEEMNYIINRLVVESFAKQTGKDLEKLDNFFKGQLTKAFEATETLRGDPETTQLIVDAIMANIDYSTVDLTAQANGPDVFDPYGDDIYASVVVGTDKVKGLRHILTLAGIDKNNLMKIEQIEANLPQDKRDKYRAAILELTSPIPKNKFEFLRCPLALKFAELAPLLLGPEHSDKLARLYQLETPVQMIALLNADSKISEVFDKFAELVKQFRAVQKGDLKIMEWENTDGLKFVLRDNSEYWTGIYRKCGNPGVFVHESVAIMQIKPLSAGAQTTATQEADYVADTNIYQAFAHWSHTEYKEGSKKPPTPPEKQPTPPPPIKRPLGEQGLTDDRTETESADRPTEEGTEDVGDATEGEEPPPA